MSLRDFFKLLPFLPFGAKALEHKTVLHPPVAAFPGADPDKVIGLWAQSWNYDTKNWSDCAYLVLREFDDQKDTWQGQTLYNPWRNKFWGRPMTGGESVLIVIDRWDNGLRFFKDLPNTDWSLIGKGILW